MIAKAKSISHGANSIDYAIDKENAEVLDKNMLVGDNGQEIKGEMQTFQDLNGRTKNTEISIVLSPEPTDGRKLTNEEFKKIGNDYLDKMGLKDHQSIIVKHTDKDHTHLHIYANRINSDGKAFNDSHIAWKSQRVGDEVAQEHGLNRAKIYRDNNIALGKLNQKEIKNEIFTKHKAVLQHRPKDFNQYKDLMKASKVDVIPTINKAGKLQGYRVEFQGMNLKATEVHRSMSLSKMGVNIKQTKAIKMNPLTPKLNKAVAGNLGKVAETALNINPALKVGFKIAKKVISKGIGY